MAFGAMHLGVLGSDVLSPSETCQGCWCPPAAVRCSSGDRECPSAAAMDVWWCLCTCPGARAEQYLGVQCGPCPAAALPGRGCLCSGSLC